MPILDLGQKIRVDAIYHRRTINRGVYDEKKWQPCTLKVPRDAIYIGYRTLSNGQRGYEEDAGYIYDPKEYYRTVAFIRRFAQGD